MENLSGLRSGYNLRDYQEKYRNLVLESIHNTKKKNYFVCLPQGCGKTIIALAVLSELVNQGLVKKTLMLSPRANLVSQWSKESRDMYYGLNVVTNPTASKKGIQKIMSAVHHPDVNGFAATIQSFKGFIRKELFKEKDFDFIIIDEAEDLIVARDFFEKYRMSRYAKGLEEWRNAPKIFLMPYQVRGDKVEEMINKFGKDSCFIVREEVKDETNKHLVYSLPEPVLIDDAYVNRFVEVLYNCYRKARMNVIFLLRKKHVKGYEQNLETLVNPRIIMKLKKNYGFTGPEISQLQTMISKYVLYRHLMNWFLYSNRYDLKRSILAEQKEVKKWLEYEDKKLIRLVEIVDQLLKEGTRMFIYAQYVATANLLYNELKLRLKLADKDIFIVTGQDQEEQSVKLDEYIEGGKVLIATPVFDKGTDIGGKIKENKAVVVYTPPYNREALHQVIKRIRGGKIVFLAYRGFEGERISQLVNVLRNELLLDVKK